MENVNLESLELERKELKKKNTTITLIGVGILLVMILLGFLFSPIFVVLGVSILVIITISNASRNSKYKGQFKEKIVKKLIKEELGEDAFYNPKSGINLGEINSLKCTSVPDRYVLSDHIICKYNGVPYEVCDAHFEERKVSYDSKGNRHVKYITYFKGRIIKIDFQRDLNINLKIVNQGPMGFSSENLDRFETEVIEFNKTFKCYVDNSENGFYILTPMFIQKLMQLEKMFRGGLVVVFKHNNLYVLINDSSDSLEVSLNKSVNGEQIERIRGEIILPASIINELRIDDDKFNVNM